LDPKYALADVDGAVEGGEDPGEKITSLKRLLNPSKKHRGGYEPTRDNLLYEEIDMWDFLEGEDPYEYLTKCNKFVYDKQAAKVLEDNAAELKIPKDMRIIIDDLKVLGRREF